MTTKTNPFDELDRMTAKSTTRRRKVEEKATKPRSAKKEPVSYTLDHDVRTGIVRAAAARTAELGVTVTASNLVNGILTEWLEENGAKRDS